VVECGKLNGQPEPPPSLSDRELQCALLVYAGDQDKEIAVTLKIARPTVRAHISRLYAKCRVRDRMGFVQWAYHQQQLVRMAALRVTNPSG
jgi:DNA-binding CsgD family transcriptional regulator